MNLNNIQSIYSTFEGCTNLILAPDDLFLNVSNVTDFSDAFLACSYALLLLSQPEYIRKQRKAKLGKILKSINEI